MKLLFVIKLHPSKWMEKIWNIIIIKKKKIYWIQKWWIRVFQKNYLFNKQILYHRYQIINKWAFNKKLWSLKKLKVFYKEIIHKKEVNQNQNRRIEVLLNTIVLDSKRINQLSIKMSVTLRKFLKNQAHSKSKSTKKIMLI